MCKRGENIYKRRDGRWEGRYRVRKNGQDKYVSVYGKTCADVRSKLLAAKQQAIAEQQNDALPKCGLTVQNIFNQWLQGKQATLKPSSYARYCSLLEVHLLPKLGNCALNSLTAQKLSVFMRDKLKSGRLDKQGGLSAKTVADMLALIKSAVRMAAREFSLPQLGAIMSLRPLVAPRSVNPTVFSEPECAAISRQIVEDTEANNAAVLFSLNTGLRLGEVCSLRWSDIDFAAQTLTVQRTVQRVGGGLLLQAPKTAAGQRTIPLTAEIILLLRGQKRRNAQEYVFGTAKPLEPRTLQYRFSALLKKCGIKRRNFHTLRHTFASRFIALGGNVKSLCEILGHANVRTTMQLYVHPSLEQKRADMELVSTLQGLNCG